MDLNLNQVRLQRKKISEKFFMQLTLKWIKELSSCAFYAVGALIVKDGRIISFGYNGTAPGVVECIEIESLLRREIKQSDIEQLKRRNFLDISDNFLRKLLIYYQNKKNRKNFEYNLKLIEKSLEKKENLVHSRYEIHAEQNAISYAQRLGLSVENSDLFVSVEPCLECAKLIVAAGIRRVIFHDEYIDKRFNERSIDFLRNHSVIVERIAINHS